MTDAEKDFAVLNSMAAQANDLLAEYENLSPSERAYASKLVLEVARLAEDFRRKLKTIS